MYVFKISILLLLSTTLNACDCIPRWTFLNSSCEKCNVLLVEIIEDTTYNNQQIAFRSDITTVLVLDQIYGKTKADTIRVLQGSGTFCDGQLVEKNIGKKLLLTGSVFPEIVLTNEKIVEIYTLTIGSCSFQSLIYESGYVYGNITRNKKKNREDLLRFILKFVPYFLIDEEDKRSIIYESSENKENMQKMSLKKLKRKLEQKYGK